MTAEDAASLEAPFYVDDVRRVSEGDFPTEPAPLLLPPHMSPRPSHPLLCSPRLGARLKFKIAL